MEPRVYTITHQLIVFHRAELPADKPDDSRLHFQGPHSLRLLVWSLCTDQANYNDHPEIKLISHMIAWSWHMLVAGMY